jgi:hypothetical protein
MNNRQKKCSLTDKKKSSLTEQKKRCRFHKRPQFSLRRADLSSQVYPGFNVKGVSMGFIYNLYPAYFSNLNAHTAM